MKGFSKNVRNDELLIDVVEYAFTKWLFRRGIYSAFMANYQRRWPHKSFRTHVRYCLNNVGVDSSCLISTAFLFESTPEGIEFWVDQSDAWERFLIEFLATL